MIRKQQAALSKFCSYTWLHIDSCVGRSETGSTAGPIFTTEIKQKKCKNLNFQRRWPKHWRLKEHSKQRTYHAMNDELPLPLISCSTSVRHRVKHVCRMCSSSLVTKRGQGPAASAVPGPPCSGSSALAGDANGESIATLAQGRSIINNSSASLTSCSLHMAHNGVIWCKIRPTKCSKTDHDINANT